MPGCTNGLNGRLSPSNGRRRVEALASTLNSEERGSRFTVGWGDLSNIIQNSVGFNDCDSTGLRGMRINHQDVSLAMKGSQ